MVIERCKRSMTIERDLPHEDAFQLELDAEQAATAPRLRTALVDPRRALPQPRHDRDGELEPQRRPPDPRHRPARRLELAAVDRRRLQPRVRRSPAHRRRARRPLRPTARAERRSRRVRPRVGVRRDVDLGDRHHRGARNDGPRRRVRDARHAVDPRPRVPARTNARVPSRSGPGSPGSASRWAA